MAHFAQLDDNNVVLQVIVIDNKELLDSNGNEVEENGVEYCRSIYNTNNWKQTSYNGSFRNKFAGIGDTYDPVRDVFIQQQPYSTWWYDFNMKQWRPPTPVPQDGKYYYYDNDTSSWIETDESNPSAQRFFGPAKLTPD